MTATATNSAGARARNRNARNAARNGSNNPVSRVGITDTTNIAAA